MYSHRPLIASLAIATVLSFSACEKDPSTECIQETISDENYFSTDRTLSNTCKKIQGIDYVLTGNKTYYISANVTIEPGTLIEIEDDAALVIETTGSLQALGTAQEPIIIRGRYNSNGHWKGLFVRSNSYSNKLDHVQLERGGGGAISGETESGAVVLLEEGRIGIHNSTIKESASYGVQLVGEEARLTQFSNNTLKGNEQAMRMYTTQATILSPTNNFSNNTNNYVELRIGSAMNKHYAWPAISIPYRLMPTIGTTTTVQRIVGSGGLAIAAGAVVEMSGGTGFDVRDMGTLTAVGTASQPILFTGVEKNYGTWKGFAFWFTNTDNRFEHVRVEHAGGEQQGVVYMWGDPKVTFTDSEFTYSPTCAFYDAPKTNSQSMNSNALILNMIYTNVNSNYCKGN